MAADAGAHSKAGSVSIERWMEAFCNQSEMLIIFLNVPVAHVKHTSDSILCILELRIHKWLHF